MADKNFWQHLGDAIKYARSTSALDGGGAYYVTSQAKEDLREQGKEDEAKQIEKAEAIGTVGGAIAGLTLGKGVPLITKGISAFRTAFPKVATGIDFALTADGIRNLATENGIQKTVNYINDGNWGSAALSGTMDALDLLGGVGIIGDVIKGAKWAKGAYIARQMNKALELPHTPQMPQPQVYGNWNQSINGFNLGYTTSGIKQTGTPTGNFHWREDITDIDNPILLDVKPDMHYTRTRTTPVIKEVTNVDDMLQRIGVVPISNTPVQTVEQIAINPANRLVKVGQRVDLTLSPNRVVQLEYQPRLVDNKGRLVSSDVDRYFGIPTKTETEYTLWHKSGGTIKIKKENKGKFTDYCNGKVTEECIRKGKNSSNPTTRKRANFAWVARHKFKHEDGGKLNYLNYFN